MSNAISKYNLRFNSDRVFEFNMQFFFWARPRSRFNLFGTTQNLAAMRMSEVSQQTDDADVKGAGAGGGRMS